MHSNTFSTSPTIPVPPQAVNNMEDSRRLDAMGWQENHKAATGPSGSPKAMADSTVPLEKAHSWKIKGPMPDKLDLKLCAGFRPNVPGARIWHEPQTDRFRAAYVRDGIKITASWPAKLGDEALKRCLRWQWAQHTARVFPLTP